LLRLYFNAAIKRFKTVVRTFQILHKMEEMLLGKQHVYVRKFEYFINKKK
jgi:hypothetical protein